MIPYDDFAKLELRVATVISADRVNGSEKLLRIKVDCGHSTDTEQADIRQIVAGIGKSYEPEALVGKQIVIIANLEPRTLMGEESRGMLLAADSEGGPVLIVPDIRVAAGAKIK